MASPNDRHLCNGIPVDHRLKQFLPSAKQKHFHGVGNHADIIEIFGDTMVRDNGTTPTKHQVDFATWLAKPDMTGGLVIALQQPAKSQVFTADVERVRDECATLAYLDESLAFVNGPGGLKTTSVFDAFPFITEQISSKELSNEAKLAYDTFLSMVEAKRPEVLFACWRIHGQDDLPFSGTGLGTTKPVKSFTFPNGHAVRVVNGFHPSYVANYCPNESRFRRLFAMELCKALCELNEAWQEDDWMDSLRRTCRERTFQLIKEEGRDGEQLNTRSGRELRGNKAANTANKYKAYTKSFDNGLKSLKQIFNHMVSSTYTSQSSWELYRFCVFVQNTSEGICDALLAVSEAMRQFAPGTSMPEPALVDLGKHISRQTLKFVRDDISDLVQYKRGLYKNLWSNRYLASTSRGLKQSLEKITSRFIEDLTGSFSGSSTRWEYDPDLVHEAFKELAVSFEDALGREYDDRRKAVAASAASSVATLSASLSTLSISTSQSATLASPAAKTTPARSSSSGECFSCGQRGHWSKECPHPKKGSTTPSKSPSNTSCYNCGKMGHWTSNCPSPKKGSRTPPRSSASSPSGNYYTYDQPAQWFSSYPSPRKESPTTPSRTPSSSKCFDCRQTGHWSSNCPRRRKGSATPSGFTPGDKCFSCGKIGHWSSNCPTRRN
ncbi:hypothetical protein F5Y19DRAFT_362181 [Xylariaceae sp. FL1651]|nr:hypothetical protein F5Y19DRAFT_362181 [Xylariaceae sp. FL1651]